MISRFSPSRENPTFLEVAPSMSWESILFGRMSCRLGADLSCWSSSKSNAYTRQDKASDYKGKRRAGHEISRGILPGVFRVLYKLNLRDRLLFQGNGSHYQMGVSASKIVKTEVWCCASMPSYRLTSLF